MTTRESAFNFGRTQCTLLSVMVMDYKTYLLTNSLLMYWVYLEYVRCAANNFGIVAEVTKPEPGGCFVMCSQNTTGGRWTLTSVSIVTPNGYYSLLFIYVTCQACWVGRGVWNFPKKSLKCEQGDGVSQGVSIVTQVHLTVNETICTCYIEIHSCNDIFMKEASISVTYKCISHNSFDLNGSIC